MASSGVGISICSDPMEAIEEVAGAVLEACPAPQAALTFLSGDPGELSPVLEALAAALGTKALVGSTAQGVVGAGREAQGGPGLAVLALQGLDVHPFLVPELDRDDASLEVAAQIGPTRAEDLVVLLPDPATLRADRLLPELQAALEPARVVGAGAVEDAAGRAHQWCGTRAESGALAGLVIRGARPPRIGVTQACRPVGECLEVTRTEGNWILEIEGRPALDLFREASGGALAGDLRRASMFTLAALPGEDRSLGPGSYLVRHLIGVSEEARAIALPTLLKPGDAMAFVHREPETARQDLKDMLAGVSAERALCGLWLDCCARGEGFFGVPGLEAAYLEQALGRLPVAGMFGACEIGPIAGSTELLTYTGVLALVEG